MSDQPKTLQAVKVWDLPTRLFHWTLVALMIAQWLTAEQSSTMDWHVWGGYAVLALVLFRLVWGFVGSETARFADFMRGPSAALDYFKALRRGETPHYFGHNPMGAWSIVALLTLLLIQAGTGLFANDDILIEGPLYAWVSKGTSDWLTTIHKLNFNLLLLVIAIHLSAVLFYLLVKHENLIHPMLSGLKQSPAGIGQSGPAPRESVAGAGGAGGGGSRGLVAGALSGVSGNEKGHACAWPFESRFLARICLILAEFLMASLAGFGGLAELRLDGLLITALGDFGQLGGFLLKIFHLAVEFSRFRPNFRLGLGFLHHIRPRTFRKTLGGRLAHHFDILGVAGHGGGVKRNLAFHHRADGLEVPADNGVDGLPVLNHVFRLLVGRAAGRQYPHAQNAARQHHCPWLVHCLPPIVIKQV